MKIACVIPAHNEERFIGGVLRAIPPRVERVFVVDDASRDGTAAAVAAVGDPRVTLLRHEVNRGLGAAMATGYRAALATDAEIVVKLDGDGQMDPAEIERLVLPIEEGLADYCKGVRFRGRDVIRRMPPVRLAGNLGLSFLTKIATGYWDLLDPTNGFTAIGRPALHQLNLDRVARGFFFETDMLFHLYLAGAVAMDVAIPARYGEETSDLSPLRALITFPWWLLRVFVRRIVWRYFIIDFSAVSAFLIVGGALFGWGLVFGLWKWIQMAVFVGAATPTGTIMLAAVPLILGFQLLLQAVVLDIQNVPRIPLQRKQARHDERR